MEGDIRPPYETAKSLREEDKKTSAKTDTPNESFQTPDQIAEQDDSKDIFETAQDNTESEDSHKKEPFYKRIKFNKREWIISALVVIIGGFIVVLTLTVASYIRVKRNEKKLEELVRKLSLKK